MDDKDIDLDGAFNDGYKAPAFWPWVFLFLVLMLAPLFVFADTLTYASQTLTGPTSTIDGGNTDIEAINDVYTVTVTVSGPLAPNLNMAPVTPQSWAVVCQNCQQDLSSNPPNPTTEYIYTAATAAVFMFSTDATGKIIGWSFALSGNSILSDGAGNITKSSNGSFMSGDTATSTESLSIGNKVYTVTTSGPKGTWTQSSLSAPAKPAPPVTPPPANTVARLCTAANNPQWSKPVQYTGFGLSSNASGSGEYCGYPQNAPPTTYIQVSLDGGKTSTFVTLASLGLGK